ncbi:hypothetical protein L596_025911 [Steinernema carpocapsae]|uniref:Uncharacterized protein n=1 Tax=Steinernema carpocapsae TaxID=34508 RepID=A0A4U5M989_STECR|nr:hypothetical protein L596_025911 [Steinernema carpocapsae]
MYCHQIDLCDDACSAVAASSSTAIASLFLLSQQHHPQQHTTETDPISAAAASECPFSSRVLSLMTAAASSSSLQTQTRPARASRSPRFVRTSPSVTSTAQARGSPFLCQCSPGLRPLLLLVEVIWSTSADTGAATLLACTHSAFPSRLYTYIPPCHGRLTMTTMCCRSPPNQLALNLLFATSETTTKAMRRSLFTSRALLYFSAARTSSHKQKQAIVLCRDRSA